MATTAPIILPIKTPGLNQLQKLEMKMKALEKTVEQLQGDLGKANEKIGKLNDEAVKASKGVAKLSRQFRSFAASLLAAGTAQAAFNTGLDRIQSNARLVALARGYEEIEQAQAAATRTAETFNLSQTEANKQFAAIYGRLRPLGLTVNQIEDAYAGLSTAVKTASLDAAGASALFTQVSQALGSGVVQAEELNTVIDQAPSIVVALAKELGVTAGEVKKLASTGQVSSEQLFKALLRVKEEGVDVLSESLNTPAEKIKAFYNTTEDIVAALTTAVIPELVDGVDDIAAALEALIPLAQVVGRTLSAAFKLAAIPAKGFGDLLANISQGNWEAVLKFDPSGFQQLGDIFGDLFAPLPEVKTGGGRRGNGSADFPTIPNRGGGGGGGSSSSRGADKAARELERQRKELEKQFEAGENIKRNLENQMMLLSAATDLEKDRLRVVIDLDNTIRRIKETAAPDQQEGLIVSATELARLEDMKLIIESFAKDVGAWDFIPEANDELTQTEQLLKGSYEIVANGLTNGIKGLIDGTKDWNDILSDVLGQLGNLLIQMGTKSLGVGLGIPGFAEGGRPPTNQPSIIGERGPELFIPDSPGTVLSNQDSKAALSSYSRMSPEQQKAADKGEDPMASAAATALQPIRMDTRVINGVEYATVEQMRVVGEQAAAEGAKQGAKIGEAQMMRRLRMNPATRRQVGL